LQETDTFKRLGVKTHFEGHESNPYRRAWEWDLACRQGVKTFFSGTRLILYARSCFSGTWAWALFVGQDAKIYLTRNETNLPCSIGQDYPTRHGNRTYFVGHETNPYLKGSWQTDLEGMR
jgi:hypothetical protein